MDRQQPASNPFALMMEPQRVIQAMERSERLARLQRRICHPLDKLPAPRDMEADFDTLVDAHAPPGDA